jgi:hypothetical protein
LETAIPKATRLLARAAAAAAAALLPLAAPAADTAYVTAAGGYTSAQTSRLGSGHQDGFAFPTGSSESENHGAMRVGGGWFVLPRVALEASWADYGKQDLSAEGAPGPALVPGVLSGRRMTERKVSAVALDMVGHWPVHPHVTLVGRVGMAYGFVKATGHVAAPGGFPSGGGPQDASYDVRQRSWAFHGSAGARWVDVVPTLDVEAMVEYLGPVGSFFASESIGGTGRSSQATVWLGLVKRF